MNYWTLFTLSQRPLHPISAGLGDEEAVGTSTRPFEAYYGALNSDTSMTLAGPLHRSLRADRVSRNAQRRLCGRRADWLPKNGPYNETDWTNLHR